MIMGFVENWSPTVHHTGLVRTGFLPVRGIGTLLVTFVVFTMRPFFSIVFFGWHPIFISANSQQVFFSKSKIMISKTDWSKIWVSKGDNFQKIRDFEKLKRHRFSQGTKKKAPFTREGIRSSQDKPQGHEK